MPATPDTFGPLFDRESAKAPGIARDLCVCGHTWANPNPDCERCQFIVEIARLRVAHDDLVAALCELRTIVDLVPTEYRIPAYHLDALMMRAAVAQADAALAKAKPAKGDQSC